MYFNLEQKFKVIYPESENATYKTLMNYSDDLEKPFQRWYRYKEGFSIDLVKQLIKEYNKNPNGIILDPFMGSGSTLLGASELGMGAIGFEVNPFTFFLAETKLKNYTNDEVVLFEKAYNSLLSKSNSELINYDLPKLSISNKTFQLEVEKWFMNLKELILKYYKNNINIMNLLLLGWLSSLESVSNYRKAGNGLKKRKYVKPRILSTEDVYLTVETQYKNILEDLQKSNIIFQNKLYFESSLKLKNRIDTETISGIIFSPPYANCFDYTEIYKLELWFGNFVKEYSDLKKLRKKSIQSHLNGMLEVDEKKLKTLDSIEKIITDIAKKELWNKKIPNMLRLYFNDMFKVLENCYNVLEKDGFCVIVVGNSSYGGIIVPTDLILAEYAKKIGFEVNKIEIDRYIITSSQQYSITKDNKKYLRESLVCLVKR